MDRSLTDSGKKNSLQWDTPVWRSIWCPCMYECECTSCDAISTVRFLNVWFYSNAYVIWLVEWWKSPFFSNIESRGNRNMWRWWWWYSDDRNYLRHHRNIFADCALMICMLVCVAHWSVNSALAVGIGKKTRRKITLCLLMDLWITKYYTSVE